MSAFKQWWRSAVETSDGAAHVGVEEAWDAAIEAAAKVCDQMHEREDDNCGEAAHCIRALKED